MCREVGSTVVVLRKREKERTINSIHLALTRVRSGGKRRKCRTAVPYDVWELCLHCQHASWPHYGVQKAVWDERHVHKERKLVITEQFWCTWQERTAKGDEEAKDLPGNVPLMCYSLFCTPCSV
jgi:hypothetical protein